MGSGNENIHRHGNDFYLSANVIKPTFQMSEKNQTIGDFVVSQILAIVGTGAQSESEEKPNRNIRIFII